MKTLCIAVALSTLLVGSLSAQQMPVSMKIGNTPLILNGSGVRTKSFLQLYQAGLYLPQKSKNASEIVNSDVPMSIRLEITSRFVSQSKMLTALNEGFVNSTGGKVAQLKNEIEQFRACFSDKLVMGDILQMTYTPGVGTAVSKNGKAKGVIKGLPFKQAMFGIWLSAKPADKTLKQAMLQGPKRG
ncbi:MAG: chalcone isomerase family protein [Planctomycetota bacterium]